ncbi:hypothetical protein NDN01_16690 [Sphingomonas sp. QA11]|uniref:hypothetical protein n=1 Tax=Sphingomonas sp. QA11 TaxID=2950605 RepID=UPI002348F1F5|nr:hypothetical protein [Sphingomonas sp. QA11]WCM25669.1 hypothetical protein NDN01_16690 [Sphingomonas sp. QA11]
MTALDDVRALNDAPSQRDRQRAAPAPARVEVDGRSLADLLAFAGEYGALITFYDLTNQPDGDWSVFFLSDPAIAQARYASLDLDEIRATFDQILVDLRAAEGAEERIDSLRPALVAILRLIRILTRSKADYANLQPALAALAGSDRRDILAAPARSLATHLGGSAPEDAVRLNSGGWFPTFLDRLEDLFSTILTALGQGRDAALRAMERSFEDPSHAPQSGLYDAFARLFQHAQNAINHFPARLIDFYQSDILRQTGRAGTPDTVCLTFTPAKGVTHVELPHDTKFLAGTDADGEEIAYALDAAFTVDLASIAALRTLTVTSDMAAVGTSHLPAQVLTGVVALSEKAPAIATPFPLFGATHPGTSGVLTTTKATLGFAVASPTLMLAGGTRAVTLALKMAPDSLTAVNEILKGIAATTGILAEDAFIQLMQTAFALRYSTAGGWIDIARYQVSPPGDDYPLFTLSFVLDTDADPLVALSTQPAATDAVPPAADSAVPDMNVPTLVADLLQEPVTLKGPCGNITVYPYSLLATMRLSTLAIDVEVVGLTDLQASTPTGPIDTSQPFLVFGSPPVQEATLQIAAPELFIKPVDSFELTIEWFGLPVTSTGFRGYYKAYVIDADGKTVPPGTQFDNQSFRAKLDVFNPGLWQTSDPAHYLFQTGGRVPVPIVDASIDPTTELVATVEPRTPPPYYDPTLSTVCLCLSQPKTAFGDVLYAPNVMAASVRLTAAASACAQQCGQPDKTHPVITHLAPIIAANGTAPDASLEPSVRAAIQRAVANLDGAALEAIEDEIAANDADPATKADWRASLSSALGDVDTAGFLRRLRRIWQPTPDVASVHASLDSWLAQNASTIATPTPARLDSARALIDAASGALDVQARAAGRPAAVARPVTAAGLRDVQTRLASTDSSDCIDKCMKGTDLLGFPNQPWLPMAASIQVTYTATTAIPAPVTTNGPDDAAPPATLFHLLPFDGVEPVRWQTDGTVPLLTPIDPADALEIGLSDPAETLTLLFQLAPPAGGWPTDTPPVVWAQGHGIDGHGGTRWPPLTPLRDTTNNLRNSGIVSLALSEAHAAQPWLRVSVPSHPTAFPKLAGLVTNAAMATWVGPGGGARLGDPLPAGTIAKTVTPLPDLGSIDQPMPSTGGAPAEIGAGFELWLAERLRHKDRGIQGWDYSRLALAAFPSLWQVAVVPASDGGIAPVPGNVWVIPVPGPQTPAIFDPTIPACDATTLNAIATYLGQRISPFIQLWVTNPPYLRLRVVADLVFTDDDTVEANKERLNQELIQYLSPWPSPALPPRPDDYYTRNEVAHFVRHRPYVRAIRALELVRESPIGLLGGFYYLTSASAHTIRGKAQPSVEPALPPKLALTSRPAMISGRTG